MGALAALAAELGLLIVGDEIQKLINDNRTLNQSEANIIANKILNKAQAKGDAMLNRALNIMQQVPIISSSTAVKEYLVKARQNAQQSYEKVEKTVADMKDKAQEAASKISDMPNRSIVSVIGDDIREDRLDKDRAQEIVTEALNNIEKTI